MKKSNKRFLYNLLSNKNIFLATVIIVLIAISYYAGVSSSGKLESIPSDGFISGIEDLSTKNFVIVKPEAAVVNNEGAVSLTGNCYRVVAGTEPHQAESIANGIEGRIIERPNTHDVLRDLLGSLNIKLVMVKVVEIRGNNFIGKIILQQMDNIVSLESKPSDGIALAVRMNSSIYMNESLMKIYGEKIC